MDLFGYSRFFRSRLGNGAEVFTRIYKNITQHFNYYRNGNHLGTINPLVDIYNSISLRYGLPCGGEDIDTLAQNIRLTKATGNENFVTKYIKRINNIKVIIIFDHTALDDRFLILKFSLKLGKRAIPIWYKIFEYNEKGNKSFEHIKQGIKEINEIFTPYNFKIILLGDRSFKSIDLFRFIDKLEWKYFIRCTNDMIVKIEGKKKIKYLRDITPIKRGARKFNGVLLSAEEYKCNLSVCKADESEDTWYLATNMDSQEAVKEYKKRFIIEGCLEI